jgi:Sec-independent protein secretion pathway component TatC
VRSHNPTCVVVKTTCDAYACSVLVGALAALVAICVCFCFSKDLVVFLEAPVATKGVRFLQLSPGEFFFTTFKARPIRWITVVATCSPYCDVLSCRVLCHMQSEGCCHVHFGGDT